MKVSQHGQRRKLCAVRTAFSHSMATLSSQYSAAIASNPVSYPNRRISRPVNLTAVTVHCRILRMYWRWSLRFGHLVHVRCLERKNVFLLPYGYILTVLFTLERRLQEHLWKPRLECSGRYRRRHARWLVCWCAHCQLARRQDWT